MSRPEELAREMYAQGEPHWSRPLTEALEQRRRGASLQWGFACVRRLLPRLVRDDRLSRCQTWLDEVEKLCAMEGTQAEAQDLGESIWYGGGRDETQTAVARLAFSVGAFAASEPNAHRELDSVMSVMSQAPPFDGKMVETIIEEFLRVGNVLGQ
jgi:hypothetical protein